MKIIVFMTVCLFQQIAGNDVKRTTDALVRSATKKQDEFVVEIDFVWSKADKIKGIRQEREAENEVNRMERELEQLRMQLHQQRKNKHKFKGK